MKKWYLFGIFFLAAFATLCFAQQQPTVVYTHNFPPDLDSAVKSQYIKIFEKGRVLYKINCSKCHDKTVNGVELMPEFTKEHLASYELRLQNTQHENELDDSHITAEQLQYVMVFLSFVKKVEPTPAQKP